MVLIFNPRTGIPLAPQKFTNAKGILVHKFLHPFNVSAQFS